MPRPNGTRSQPRHDRRRVPGTTTGCRPARHDHCAVGQVDLASGADLRRTGTRRVPDHVARSGRGRVVNDRCAQLARRLVAGRQSTATWSTVEISGGGTPDAIGRLGSGTADCGNSGTSIRLLTGVAASGSGVATLVGDESLSRRPMARVADPLRRWARRSISRTTTLR